MFRGLIYSTAKSKIYSVARQGYCAFAVLVHHCGKQGVLKRFDYQWVAELGEAITYWYSNPTVRQVYENAIWENRLDGSLLCSVFVHKHQVRPMASSHILLFFIIWWVLVLSMPYPIARISVYIPAIFVECGRSKNYGPCMGDFHDCSGEEDADDFVDQKLKRLRGGFLHHVPTINYQRRRKTPLCMLSRDKKKSSAE